MAANPPNPFLVERPAPTEFSDKKRPPKTPHMVKAFSVLPLCLPASLAASTQAPDLLLL